MAALKRLYFWVAVISLSLPSIVLAAEEEAHHVSPFMEISRIINFLIFAFILYKLAGEPIKNFFKNRTQSIEAALKEAQKAKEESEKKFKEYELKLIKADEELKQMLQNAEREGQEQMKRIQQETEKIVDRIKEQAEAAADLEVKKARVQLQKEYADLAVKLAEGLLKEAFTEEDQKRLIKDYTAKIKEVH